VEILALFGPTGVGKTAVAIALGERLRARGEDPVAVSADALQVYRGLEVLTGVASAEEQARLEHRLVSFLPVTETFSAGQYAQRAHAEIDGLLAEGRRPIVVGGTGLYLRAALAELELRPPADTAAHEHRPAAELHAELTARAPHLAARLDPADPRKLARSLALLDQGI
jgi:tRNA dimethylallyltransferase